VALDVLDHDDRVVHDDPVASTIPNRVRVLIEKPNSLTKAKVPIRETGW